MSVSLQQRLIEVAKEYEDTKFRQLDLYQRQLRKARDSLAEKERLLAESAAELDDARARAEQAEAKCAAESRGSVEMTREIIALKFELGAALEALRDSRQASAGAGADEEGAPPPEPAMPADVMTAEAFRGWVAQEEVSVLRSVLQPECRRGDAFRAEMGLALLESCASGRSDGELPQLLLSAGADAAVAGSGGRTPLHAAAAAGNNQLVQLLIQREGVDKDAQDAQERTPLHLAARSKRARVVQTLLQLGANADLQTAEGKTARDIAVDPMIGTGDPAVLSRVFDSTETRFWNHSARAVAMHRADELEPALTQYTLAIGLAKQLKYTLSADDKARLHLNRARVAQRLSKHTQTMQDCEEALGIDAPDSHRKALAVRAESAMALLDFERAAADLKAVVDEDDYGEQAERWADMLKESSALAARTYYEVLNVPTDATAAEIKKAFRRESITWHPDKHAGDADAQARATLKFKQLNEANQHLSDQSKRFAYDRKLRYGVGGDDYDTSFGRYGRHEKKAWRESLVQRQRETEEELANSKAHREKVQKQKEREEQERVEQEAAARRLREDEETKAAAEAEDRVRKTHLDSEMRRLEELAALQRQREEEIAVQRRVANDLADQLRQLQEQQLFESDEEEGAGEDGLEQDAAYRRAYEEYLRRRNGADVGQDDLDSEDDEDEGDYETDLSGSESELDETVTDEEELEASQLDGDALSQTADAEFVSDDPFDSFRLPRDSSAGGESDDDSSGESDGEVMAAAQEAMLRAEQAIDRHAAAQRSAPPPPADAPEDDVATAASNDASHDEAAPVEEGIDHQQTVAWAGGDAEADGGGAEDDGGAEEADSPDSGRSPIASSDPPPPAEDGAKSASKVPSPVFAGVGDGVLGEAMPEEGGKGSSGGSWLEELRAELKDTPEGHDTQTEPGATSSSDEISPT